MCFGTGLKGKFKHETLKATMRLNQFNGYCMDSRVNEIL